MFSSICQVSDLRAKFFDLLVMLVFLLRKLLGVFGLLFFKPLGKQMPKYRPASETEHPEKNRLSLDFLAVERPIFVVSFVRSDQRELGKICRLKTGVAVQ